MAKKKRQKEEAEQGEFPEVASTGIGCSNCAVSVAVIHLQSGEGFSRSRALCLDCLGLWFPGWSRPQIQRWLVEQQDEAKRQVIKQLTIFGSTESEG